MSLTVDEFVGLVEHELNKGQPGRVNQREGQWWFNRLHDFRPDVANLIRSTLDDPFYQDHRITDFMCRLIDLW